MICFSYRKKGCAFMSCNCLENAKMLLDKTGSTCVLCNGNIILTDNRRGVRPLLDILNSDVDVIGFAAADKVVGKAAAYLYCLLRIGSLYAKIISQPALEVLAQAQISVEYDTLVPAIQNRTGDGPCPMEHAVWNVSDAEDALRALQAKLEELSK